jgi:hypothetical protein
MSDSTWISVRDRLPDESGVYKVKGFRGSIDRKAVEEEAYFNGKHKHWATFFDWDVVTHWMPIPDMATGGE